LILSSTDDIVVVGEASNGAEAIRLVGELQPNVVLMDVMMPELDGIGATQQLLQLYPHMHVLALTSFSDGDLVRRVLQGGACGCLLKNVDGRELTAAIRTADTGRVVLTEETMQALVRTVVEPAKPGGDLSERELEVLAALVEGDSNDQIAAKLYISRNTVRHHVHNILIKLGAVNRTEAVALALQHNLVEYAAEVGA
ncbi:MAG TPA: response regulator transcription factor, partial [Roseiflexaceae bacterium]|nr:response regulator transcription factor [Roseiflexaceae bacterium]